MMIEFFRAGDSLRGLRGKLNALVTRAMEGVIGRDGIVVDYVPGKGHVIGFERSVEAGEEGGDSSQCYKVVGIENDYLVCRTWDGEEEGEDDVLVAKPWMLRHDAVRYPWLASLVTREPQIVDVELPGDIETVWMVTPLYYEGCLIQASERVTELEVDDDPVVLMDMNHDARAWAEVYVVEDEE